ncbi:hypothetical protein MRX96_056341 [Rhipicephalus microplus]
MLETRSDKGAIVLKITEHLTLNLEKSSILSKSFLLRTYEDKIMKHTYGCICIRVEFTENLRWLMQLTAEFEEGMINARMRIVPLQTHERSEDGRMAHILIEIPDDVSNYNEDYGKDH